VTVLIRLRIRPQCQKGESALLKFRVTPFSSLYPIGGQRFHKSDMPTNQELPTNTEALLIYFAGVISWWQIIAS
jgi:hypothetical protein